MYAACAWVVQLLLAVSKRGTAFSYVPEVYVESLVSPSTFLRNFLTLRWQGRLMEPPEYCKWSLRSSQL